MKIKRKENYFKLKSNHFIYEIDEIKKRIRSYERFSLVRNDWQSYEDISYPTIGKPLYIVFSFIQDSAGNFRTQNTTTEVINTIIIQEDGFN